MDRRESRGPSPKEQEREKKKVPVLPRGSSSIIPSVLFSAVCLDFFLFLFSLFLSLLGTHLSRVLPRRLLLIFPSSSL